jgi:hypothetical protein
MFRWRAATATPILFAVVLLGLPTPSVFARAPRRAWHGKTSQGLPVSVVTRPNGTVQVTLTVDVTCVQPSPQPPYPPEPGGTSPQPQALVFSVTLAAANHYTLSARSPSEQLDATGQLTGRTATGTLKLTLFRANNQTCSSGAVGFRARR